MATQRTPNGILIAQAVGITTSFFLLGTFTIPTLSTIEVDYEAIPSYWIDSHIGQNTTFSFSSVPSLMLAPAPLAARQWKQVFDQGKIVGPGLAVVGTIATGYLAYACTLNP